MNIMKKSLTLLFAVVGSLFINSAHAQGSGGKCYDENTHLLNLGLGFGNSYYKFNNYKGYESGRTPVFILSYEQPLRNKVGPGFLGVGAYVSYQNAHERYDYDYYYNGNNRFYYRHNWNHFVIAGRAAYHWDVLNAEKAELYGGTTIGVRINSYSYTTNNPDPDYRNYELNEGAVYPAFAVFAGARWYFVPSVALYAEVASGISFLSGGLTFKF
jgi:hypothetical protein